MPMKTRLTDREIAKLPENRTKDEFAWDTSLAGFGLKLSAGGGRSFVFQYRSGGKTRRLTIGSADRISASTARDRAEAALTAIRDGRDPAAEKTQERQAQTLSEHAAEWLALQGLRVKRDELSARTLAEYESKLRVHILPAFGSMKPTEITRQAILQWRDKVLLNGAGSEGIKGVLRVLSACIGHMVQRGVVGSNPSRGMGQFATAKRERYLTADEAARLGEVLNAWEKRGPVWVAVIRVALFSGMRKGEALALRWDDIDVEHGVIRLKVHKTARQTGTKSVPLTEPLREVLARAAEWRRPGNPYVFPEQSAKNVALQKGGRLPQAVNAKGHASPGGMKRPWTLMREEAGLLGDDRFRFHDTRHHWGGVAASDGIGLQVIGRNLGHSSSATTARYAKSSTDAAAQAADTVARLVQERLATKPMERGTVVKLPRKAKHG